MDAVDVLMEARAYIEKGWCQETASRNEHGLPVEPESAEARQWCVVGALMRVTNPDPVALVWSDAVDLLGCATACGAVDAWNDVPSRSQEEVLEAFDRAIGLGLERAGER